MKYSIVILLFAVCNVSQAQKNVLTTDTTIAIPRLDFDANGNLVIEASHLVFRFSQMSLICADNY